MKGKSKKILAGFLAVLMAFGLLPLSLLGNSVVAKAADITPAAVEAGGEVFSINGVKLIASQSIVVAEYGEPKEYEGIAYNSAFKSDGVANAKVGGSKARVFGYLISEKDAEVTLVTNIGKASYVFESDSDLKVPANDTNPVTFEAGTALVQGLAENKISLTANKYYYLMGVGTNIEILDASVKVTAQTGGEASGDVPNVSPENHVFDASVELAGLDKSAAIAADTKYAEDFFTVYGNNKKANWDTAAIEFAKGEGTSGIKFTVPEGYTAKVTVSARGAGSGKAGILKLNNETKEFDGATVEDQIWRDLAAGDYDIACMSSAGGTRVTKIVVALQQEVAAPAPAEHVFDASVELAALDKSAAIAADTKYAGDFFTVYGSNKKANWDTAAIELAKGEGTSGIKFTVPEGYTAKVTVSARGAGSGKAGVLKLNNETKEFDGATVEDQIWKDLAAGDYDMACMSSAGGTRVTKIVVALQSEGTGLTRKAWSDVSNPVVTKVEQKGGKIVATVSMVVGDNGADSVKLTVLDASGKELKSLASKKEQDETAFEYEPTATGSYSVIAEASREDETEVKKSDSVKVDFALPLAAPSIASATSTGAGKVSVVWGAVSEADSYNVYVDGKLVGTTKELSYVVSGLTVGNAYKFTVSALRASEEGSKSAEVTTTVTAEAQQVWGFTRYGSSTDSKNNGYTGAANDGKVTVYSEGGKGKVVPNSTDGLAFYYTAVPTEYNFTLRANVHVDNWTFSNGQEGFGLLATDRLGENGVTSPIWNNQYMALASKIEYYYNEELGANSVSGSKYTMKCGVGVIEKSGVTKDNLGKLEANDTATVQNEFRTATTTLEASLAEQNYEAGTYNIIGNATAAVEGTVAELTDFILEIQKNNTGYFITYYDQNGEVIKKLKYYEPDALNHIDSDNVYVGFFASRNARATFTNIQFSTILASADAPAEERPITYIEPSVNITSAKMANTEDYTFVMIPNVAGYVNLVCNNVTLAQQVYVAATEKFTADVKLPGGQQSEFFMEFFPDASQELEPYTALANTDRIESTFHVNRSNIFDGRTNIYVAPNGSEYSSGSESNPVDIYTAVKYAQPGQTIILKGGVYELESTVTVARGVNGTADAMIRMIADPNASERPVFDFQGMCAGMVLGGDYWYFQGFDCTNSMNGQKGIQVSGDHNIVDGCHMYHNGNTGLQISRMYSTDLFEDWPSYNLILNCTSYGNADAGYEDADGFAAKLTVADGNVFDGCLAYNNADDGWDLFAKVETGSIGSVTIKNCVAYGNGYLEDGTNAGNGNGFKMGGDSMSGYHKLINSYAFFNKAKGIDSNSCPDIQVENSISYNNESYNVAFYTNNAANTDFGATGIISFKDETIKKGLTTGEQHKPVGSQNTSKYLGDSNYYWDGTKSVNASGKEVTADWFKTLEFTGITRNADGTLNLNGFLELTDAADSTVGAVPGGTPSSGVVVAPETKVDEVEESSGSAIGGGVAAAPEDTVTTEETNYDNYIPVSVFNDLMVNGKTLVVDAKDDAGNVVATYTIDGKTFTAVPDSDFELKVQENVTNNGIADVIKASLNVDAATADIISFTHHGVLNGTISVKLNLLSNKYAVGTALKLYYFNENTRTLDDTNQTVTVAADNTVTFTIDHCSYYVLVPVDAAAATTPEQPTPADPTKAVETADTNPIALLMVFALLSGAAFLVASKKRIME